MQVDYEVEAVVIGAGVVGLAVARALALRGVETVLLESHGSIGHETSSRNSEVIHAGIYYPPGSAKAMLCVKGKAMLYDFLESRRLPFSRCGKLIVAGSDAESDRLQMIRARAEANGVTDLITLDEPQIADLEPAVKGVRGVFSPSTGILDSHQLMVALQGEFESAGGVVAFASPVLGGQIGEAGEHRLVVGGAEPATLGCRKLVNAAGLHAHSVLRALLQGIDGQDMPRQYYAKGHYYAYSGSSPFSHLVYPVPASGGLGIHSTFDLAGQVRFGPDVQWVSEINYDFDTSRFQLFVDAIRTYFPGLDASRLVPAYTGIRPKIVGPGETDGDFLFFDAAFHGRSGFISLHGMESPGLTASLAIAERVVERVLG
jgi:L-2-hydroxyglutarate oxidase LhgO